MGKEGCLALTLMEPSPGMLPPTCEPSYSGGWAWRMASLRPIWAT